MSTTIASPRFWPGLTTERALRGAVTSWFIALVTGQTIFAVTIALFYGATALRGDELAWGKRLAHGYVPGDRFGNAALFIHLAAAFVILLCGTLQLIPRLRARHPRLHRWIGRTYMATAILVSCAGLYLLISRGTGTSQTQEVATGLLAVVILGCAALAWRAAWRRDFAAHRRWALRLFLVVGSALFIRTSVVLVSVVLTGAGALDPTIFRGPILTVISFGQYVLPLAVLEWYFWTQRHGGSSARGVLASAIFALTLALSAGIAGASVVLFAPEWRAAIDTRRSIAETISPTLATQGVAEAAAQYHALHETQAKLYDFDEDELNTLGYQLLNAHHTRDAIAIFALNTQTYPKSGNTWDSLAEAQMDDGDTKDAVTNYHKSLTLNPANRNAITMLAKMGAK